MTERPKVQLSRLRDIAWDLWDPIGVKHIEGHWEGSGAAAEYDSYMLRVSWLVRNGGQVDDAVAYLMQMESEHMGLGPRPDARDRAVTTVEAVRAYARELDG